MHTVRITLDLRCGGCSDKAARAKLNREIRQLVTRIVQSNGLAMRGAVGTSSVGAILKVNTVPNPSR